MCLRLSELQVSDDKARKIRAEGLKSDYEEVDGVLYYQRLPFVLEAIRKELISWHHNDPLIRHFGIDKTRELVGRKYYWPSLRRDVESYVRGCDVCLASKVVRHKPYGDLQFCLYQLIGGRTSPWTLLQDCRCLLTGRATAKTSFSWLLTHWPRWCTTSQSKSP